MVLVTLLVNLPVNFTHRKRKLSTVTHIQINIVDFLKYSSYIIKRTADPTPKYEIRHKDTI